LLWLQKNIYISLYTTKHTHESDWSMLYLSASFTLLGSKNALNVVVFYFNEPEHFLEKSKSGRFKWLLHFVVLRVLCCFKCLFLHGPFFHGSLKVWTNIFSLKWSSIYISINNTHVTVPFIQHMYDLNIKVNWHIAEPPISKYS